MLTVPLLPYQYQNYKKDPPIDAMFQAARERVALEYSQLLAVNLPIWATKSGAFLDYIGLYLYAFPRPSVPTYSTAEAGPYNTLTFNSAEYNSAPIIRTVVSAQLVSDDVYKRCLQWRMWRGDGKVFALWSVRQRIARWFDIDYNEISLAIVGSTIAAAIPEHPLFSQFKFLFENGQLPLPLGFSGEASLFGPTPP
jgi:hypothetical protein